MPGSREAHALDHPATGPATQGHASIAAVRPWVALAGLGALWLISLTFIGVGGEFPLDDDWVYAETVRASTAAGRLAYHDLHATLMLPQLALGWLASAVFGFSFVTLRATTLATGIGASVAMFLVLRSAGASPRTALLGSLTLAFSPVFQSLSYTFMSDVPTAALGILAIWSFVLAEQRRSTGYLALAGALALLAALNRHTALVLLAGFAIGHAAIHRNRRALVESALLVCAAGALYLLVERSIEAAVGLPGVYRLRSNSVASAAWTDQPFLVAGMGWRFVRSWTTLGLFALPMFVLYPRRMTRLDLAAAGGLTIALAVANRPMPLVGNIWDRHGVGPILIEGLTHPGLPAAFWWAVTFAAALGALRLAIACLAVLGTTWRIWRGTAAPGWRDAVQLASAVSIAMLVLLHAPLTTYDRYLLLVLPCAIVLAVTQRVDADREAPRVQRAAAWGLVAAFALFGVLAVRDSLSWQRTRWTVIERTIAAGIDPETIEGGYEYDGWTRGRDARPANRLADIRFVDALPHAAAIVCASYAPIIGPRQAAICAVPRSR